MSKHSKGGIFFQNTWTKGYEVSMFMVNWKIIVNVSRNNTLFTYVSNAFRMTIFSHMTN
jgi:hypothetical protein